MCWCLRQKCIPLDLKNLNHTLQRPKLLKKIEIMKQILNWALAATLICGASVFTSCSSDDDNNNPSGWWRNWKVSHVPPT